jgi:adenylosuccinate lyase
VFDGRPSAGLPVVFIYVSDTKSSIPNILAARYASNEMAAIWAPETKVRLEREFWLEVLEGQTALGINVPVEAAAAYRSVIDQIDLASIDARERITRHDVKARIDEFNTLAGHQHIHKGLTSRDLTENVEQMQILQSLTLVRDKIIAAVSILGVRASQYSTLVMAGRSHNVPAQATTLGKRLATTGGELFLGLDRLNHLIETYPLRGLKGPVGTQQDLLDLFDGDSEKVQELENRVAKSLGMSGSIRSVGQVYPRSLDLDVVSALVQATSGLASFATTLRLMAGADLATEGFRDGQVGSSAMPHKMNARSSERITGFHLILKGHLIMAAGLAGTQWNEGDVSCSVVRRIMLPDAFFATDGMLETSIEVLTDFGPYEAMVKEELMRNLPFLATTKLLVAAVKAGQGREEAHERIKHHAVNAARSRLSGDESASLFEMIADDPLIPLTSPQINALISEPLGSTGTATAQVATFVARVEALRTANPQAVAYRPQPVL